MQWSNTASIASGVWRCLRHRPRSKQCSIWNRVRCASPQTRPSKASPCKRYKVVLKLKWEAKPMHRSTARRRAPALPLCSKQRDLAKRAFFLQNPLLSRCVWSGRQRWQFCPAACSAMSEVGLGGGSGYAKAVTFVYVSNAMCSSARWQRWWNLCSSG